jgi:hypothetical protein
MALAYVLKYAPMYVPEELASTTSRTSCEFCLHTSNGRIVSELRRVAADAQCPGVGLGPIGWAERGLAR